MTHHGLADRLDDFGRTGANLVQVPASLLREAAFELREQAKDLARLRGDRTDVPPKPVPPALRIWP